VGAMSGEHEHEDDLLDDEERQDTAPGTQRRSVHLEPIARKRSSSSALPHPPERSRPSVELVCEPLFDADRPSTLHYPRDEGRRRRSKKNLLLLVTILAVAAILGVAVPLVAERWPLSSDPADRSHNQHVTLDPLSWSSVWQYFFGP
jgi:hypothetical protein